MKRFIFLSFLVLSQVLGDIWLSRGMKQFGEVNLLDSSRILPLIVHLFTNPWIGLGILFLVGSLLLYLSAISQFDLSYILPIHASSYVLNVLFAQLILGENISATRWFSTCLIALGVLAVGFSEHPPSKPDISRLNQDLKNKKIKRIKNNLLFFLLPFSFSVAKTWLAVIILVFADAGGDLFLAAGMKQIGEVQLLPNKHLLKLGRKIMTNPAILSGILCQATGFVMFISLLSWEDISVVRPVTALTYILSLLGARFFLKEIITTQRFAGIILIGCGVVLISLTSTNF